MGRQFEDLQPRTSIGGSDNFVVSDLINTYRVPYSVLETQASHVAKAAGSTAGADAARIIASAVAQDVGTAAGSAAGQAVVAATSAALRDDITSIRAKHTSIANLTAGGVLTSANLATTSAELRDDIVSLRNAKVSINAQVSKLAVSIQENFASIGTEQIYVSAINVAKASSHLREYIDDTATTGVIRGGAITSVGPGLVYCSAATAFVRQSNNKDSTVAYVSIAGASVSVNTSGTNFIYINYNGGAPQWIQSPTALSDVYQNVIVGVVFGDEDVLHVSNVNVPTQQIGQQIGRRLGLVEGVTRQTGLGVSETGTRNISVAAGVVWLALTNYTLGAIDTSGSDTFYYYYQNGSGGVTEVQGATQINNTQYDDGSGTLATLANNQYGVHWVYKGLDGDTYVVYGTDSYTLTEAEETAQEPTVLPIQITGLHAILIAKIIIAKGASTFTDIQSAFGTTFTAGAVGTHNDLGGIQGGAASEYYHLTSAQYTEYTSITGVVSKHTEDITSIRTKHTSVATELAAETSHRALLSTNALSRVNTGQIITGGALVSVYFIGDVSTGTQTLDYGLRPMQAYNNMGAHTLAPDTQTGYITLLIKASTGAGAITTTGWTLVDGDAYETSVGGYFIAYCQTTEMPSGTNKSHLNLKKV